MNVLQDPMVQSSLRLVKKNKVITNGMQDPMLHSPLCLKMIYKTQPM
jgi:hypothetical protein